jgi:xylulose-5-phosphate/fructose-6-phosphate phosphoketolase
MNVPVSARNLTVDKDVAGQAKGSGALDLHEWRQLDAYWRAANYLSVGQIYLYDNAMLREPLTLAHVKPLVVGHWGTTPGQNFIYVHLNRAIRLRDLDMIYIAGPDTAVRPWSPTPISRAVTARSIPTSARTKSG